MNKDDFTTTDIQSLADELGEILDGHDVELGLSSLMTCIGALCAQYADNKSEFRAIIARVATCLNAGCVDTAISTHTH